MAEIQFEWNESNTDHVVRHGVTPVETDEGFDVRAGAAVSVDLEIIAPLDDKVGENSVALYRRQ
jgi:hypothetical protein